MLLLVNVNILQNVLQNVRSETFYAVVMCKYLGEPHSWKVRTCEDGVTPAGRIYKDRHNSEEWLVYQAAVQSSYLHQLLFLPPNRRSLTLVTSTRSLML